MKAFRIEVFQKNDAAFLLRLRGDDDELLQERPLDGAAIQKFVEDVEAGYLQPAPDLAAFGGRLYEWLDGPTERWMEKLRQENNRLAIHIAVEQRLRALPWELLHDGAGFLCTNPLRPFTPVRHVRRIRQPTACWNRPLHLLFMACSPEDVKPVLAFEHEESLILKATQRQPIEMIVEESGSLPGLAEQVASKDEGYFDAFHLTGHAEVRDGVPVFILEDEIGLAQPISAPQLAQAFGGRWPRIVFLSGCETGQSSNSGSVPSFCEAMVEAGATAVLGWALPVREYQASVAAAEFYRNLAIGKRIDESVARARQKVFESRLGDWHLLQLYADATPLSEVVTPLDTSNRTKMRARKAHEVFLDAGAKVEVCPKDLFVGRRRPLQRCLRVLRSVPGDTDYHEGILLYGMAGLGKSSLAARLCERLPQYVRVVWAGAVDMAAFLHVLRSHIESEQPLRTLASALPLKTRLRKLLTEHLGMQSMLFVFDDFEKNLDSTTGGGRILKPEALDVLTSVLEAIRETASDSRVLVTCRYLFPLPGCARLSPESLESMRGSELERKLEQLPEIASLLSKSGPLARRANELAGGNPRLLKAINEALPPADMNEESVLSALEQSADRFWRATSLHELIAQQSEEGRRALAFMATYELPVERLGLEAVAGRDLVAHHLSHMAALGLVERGLDRVLCQEQFLVSAVIRPLLVPLLSDQERSQVCRLAMNHLCQTRWTEVSIPDLLSLLEIHRLAVLAREKDIAAEACYMISVRLLAQAAYRNVEGVCQATLTLGEDYRVLQALSAAEIHLGKTQLAREHCQQALAKCPPPSPHVPRKTLHLRIVMMQFLACVLAQQGEVESAVDLWKQALGLTATIGADDVKTAVLDQMAHYLAQRGRIEEAMKLWDQSIELNEQIGNKYGLAAALHNKANVIGESGDHEQAMALWSRSLKLKEQIGDIPGQIITLCNIADALADDSNYERAAQVLDRAGTLAEATADAVGLAGVLRGRAYICGKQGKTDESVSLFRQSLLVSVRTEHVQGITNALFSLAGELAETGNAEWATPLLEEALPLVERVGSPKQIVHTMLSLVGLLAAQGRGAQALSVWNRLRCLETRIGQIEKPADLFKGVLAAAAPEAAAAASEGYLAYAEKLWDQSLALAREAGDLRFQSGVLHNRATAIARRAMKDIDQAGKLWTESLELSQRIGDRQGIAATLHEMAALVDWQGQKERAMELYEESLELEKQIGNIPGQVTTLRVMGDEFARQGDWDRALGLWKEAVKLNHELDDVDETNRILLSMSKAIGKSADTEQALGRWDHIIQYLNDIGEQVGKATALLGKAHLLGNRGADSQALDLLADAFTIDEKAGFASGIATIWARLVAGLKEQDKQDPRIPAINLRAARALASRQDWPNLINVLTEMGTSEIEEATVFLAQALWLVVRLPAPVELAVQLASTWLKKCGASSPLSLLAATAACSIVGTDGESHPKRDELIQTATSLLSACAEKQGVQNDQLQDWINGQRLDDPQFVGPAFDKAVMEAVGEKGWLFDHESIPIFKRRHFVPRISIGASGRRPGEGML